MKIKIGSPDQTSLIGGFRGQEPGIGHSLQDELINRVLNPGSSAVNRC